MTIDCIGSKVPKMLVDNGSSINVCPMRTAIKIRLITGKLSLLSLTIRAYDESSRGVIETFEAECQLRSVSSSMLFHVLEITTSYNLLLRRAWMHPLGIMPSTVHKSSSYHGKEESSSFWVMERIAHLCVILRATMIYNCEILK